MEKLRNSTKSIRNISVITLFVMAIVSFNTPYPKALVKMRVGGTQDSLLVDKDGNKVCAFGCPWILLDRNRK